MSIWQFLIVLYLALTVYGIKGIFELHGGVRKIVNRTTKMQGNRLPPLASFLIFFLTAWWLGVCMLFSFSREVMAKDVLQKLKNNPDNNITAAEEGAILRYIDEFKEK